MYHSYLTIIVAQAERRAPNNDARIPITSDDDLLISPSSIDVDPFLLADDD